MKKLPDKPKRNGEKVFSGEISVIYARYSSHAQKDISIDQQVALCRQLAEDSGMTVDHVYADRAISGKTDQRPDFQAMMRDAAKGKFRYVVAWKSNRIGRNMLEAMLNEARLQDYGVRIIYVEEDFDDTAAGRFAARSMMNVNQFYIENMAEDIRRGLYDNASKCLVTNGLLPFGFKADADLHYALDPPNDAVVREIFQRIAVREPYANIIRDLNARGIKTSRGGEWRKSSFAKMLVNERYRGVYIYGDVRVEGGVPRIVSDELFYQVQEVLKTRNNAQSARRVNGDYLLTGKLYCGECKSHMIGMSGTSKTGDPHYYYVCSNKRSGNGCKLRAFKRDSVELGVANAIKTNVLTDECIAWIVDNVMIYQKSKETDDEIRILNDRLTEIRISINNVMKAIEQGIITPTTKSRLQELEAERTDTAGKIALKKADKIDVSRDDIIAWLYTFKDGDVNDKTYQCELFNVFVDRVYIYDDGNMKIIFSTPGGEKSADVSLFNAIADNNTANINSSFIVRFEPPEWTQTNSHEIVMISGLFVVSCRCE